MLTEMLEQAGTLNNLTVPEKRIMQTLASKFQSSTEYLFLDPEELKQSTNIGTKDQWQELLNYQETKSFIQGQMAFLAQISQRKTFRSLVEMAMAGGQGAQQAAKQVQELSGILNQQDTNRVIVLHQIPRPKKETEKQEVTN